MPTAPREPHAVMMLAQAVCANSGPRQWRMLAAVSAPEGVGRFMPCVRGRAKQVQWSRPPDIFESSNLVERPGKRPLGRLWDAKAHCLHAQASFSVLAPATADMENGVAPLRGFALVDWFALTKPAVPLVTGTLSLYDRVRGKAPIVDLAPGKYGAVLHLANERNETVIIERIDAAPPLLAFAAGREHRDLIKAQSRLKPGEVEGAFAILRPNENIDVEVVALNAFDSRPAEQKIKLTLRWRTSSRSMFSRRTISKAITVKDVTDVVAQSHRRRQRPS